MSIKLLRKDPAGEFLELCFVSRARQVCVPDVVAEIKTGVVDPDRSALDRGELEALPVAGEGPQACADVVAEALDIEAARGACKGSSLEHRDRAHVHVGIAGLEGEE